MVMKQEVLWGTINKSADYSDTATQSVAEKAQTTDQTIVLDTFGFDTLNLFESCTAVAGAGTLDITVKTSPNAAGPWLTLSPLAGTIAQVTGAVQDSACYGRVATIAASPPTGNLVMCRFVQITLDVSGTSVTHFLTGLLFGVTDG